jgi:ATP-dependent exoDNAse (exonuclease V) beta subunit
VVGDPKQSIYRFRDADVSVFEDLCARLPRRLSLTWNFRSRPGIIEFANRVCAPAFEASSMEYEALQPKREADAGAEAVVKLEVAAPAELGAWVRAQREAGIELHEMALLLRKIRGGNAKWLKALTAAGIPIAVGSGGLFWEDPRVRELASFLKWWDNPGNSLSGAVFLRAPWVGIPDAELDRWLSKDPTWAEPFFGSEHPLARRLAPLRGKPVRPGELLVSLLLDDAMERELGVALLGLWHRAEELSSRGLDFRAVVQELARAMEEARRERDVPPPRNLGQLTVLTLHGSKGLEFPHVILLDFNEKPARAGNSPLLNRDRRQGAYLAGRTESGARDAKNPLELAWKQAERQKELAESKRLFYVALTRAQERLVLVLPQSPPDTSAKAAARKEESPLERDHWRGWVEAAAAEVPAGRIPPSTVATGERPAPAAEKLTRVEPARLPVFKRARHSVTEWNTLARCARAYEWTYVRPVPVVEGIAEAGLFSGSKPARFSEQELTQRELGTRVHACLENGDFDGLRALQAEAGEDRFFAEPVISWAMSSPLMKPADTASSREVWTELAFEVPVAGEILVGSLDRLVAERAADGRTQYTLVDFKVTEKLKSVDALSEAYRHQMQLYAWAIGAIEPAARGRISALLVNIAARTVQTLPVDIGAGPVEEIASEAGRIVAGAEGGPRPGPLCRVCEFRARCREGAAHVAG